MKPLEIGTRLELFVDDHLVERMTGVAFRLHAPVRQAPAKSPLPRGDYGTIIKDGDLYRAYYRSDIPGYEVGRQTRNADNAPNEITCYAESRDGIEWTFPDLGITEIQSSKGGNVILARQVPFTHNFTPFLDTRPGVGPDARYKALAGSGGTGLIAFKSADGIHWSKIQDAAVIQTPSSAPGTPWPFDSPSPAFWSEAENCYVAFVRTWGKTEPPQTDPDKKFQRRVSQATSTDFITWTPLVDTGANLPGEQLYTNQTHPYFRAPHINIATMMRFTQGIEMGEPVEGNNGSSDIVLMTMRAGSAAYQRTFREAFIRPGLDPQRWARKANSAWLNVVPTGDAEMSLYHVNGDRYTLRTDGFISVNAGADGGELLTKPLIFAGDALSVNFSTGAAGSLRVEIQDASGQALPGFGLDDCQAVIGDAIERQVRWKNNPDLAAIAGKPVRLRFALRECDLYSFRFHSKFTLEVQSMSEAGETTRRLFLDDHHIEGMTGLSRVYHQPVKDPAPVIVPDKPWETNGWVRPVGWYPYGSHTQVWSPPVWNPELSTWQLWYQGGMEGLPLYAESTDGVNWIKPNLGLYEWGGNKNNNITLLPTAPYTQPNAPHYRIVAIRDTFETNPNRRYKGLLRESADGLMRLISPDGKTWTREGTDVIAGGDEYRLGQDPVTGQFWATVKLRPDQVPGYTMPADYHPPAYRLAWLRTSSDFVTWTPPQLVAYGSTSDQTQAAAQIAAYKANPSIRKLLYDQPTTLLVNRPAGQSGSYTADVYHMPVFRYQDMFLGLPTRMLQTGWFWPVDKPEPANNDGWQFPYLVSSRDLAAWNKHTGNPFCDVSPLSDTQKVDYGMIQMQPPITLGNQLVFYYSGFRFTHHLWWKMDPTWDRDGIPGLDYDYTAADLTPEECAKEPSVAIHVARLRLDGFASLRAGNMAGEVVTKSLPVNGKSLYVNAAAQAGTLKAELLDAATVMAIPGYTLADSVALRADSVRAKLQWQGVTDLSALAGRSVKIRFSVQNADLYSFWFDQ